MLAGEVCLGIALLLLVGLGYVLLTNKEFRQNTDVSVWIFRLWSLSLALVYTYGFLIVGVSRVTLVLFFAKFVAIASTYMASNATKKIENLKRNMVIAFIMTTLFVIISVVSLEISAKGTGYIGGATLLTLAMLTGGLTCFYLTFAILMIQIPDADKNPGDELYYSVRIYIDVFYAIFLVLAMLWERVWNGSGAQQ